MGKADEMQYLLKFAVCYIQNVHIVSVIWTSSVPV